jgi:hypothetical protein
VLYIVVCRFITANAPCARIIIPVVDSKNWASGHLTRPLQLSRSMDSTPAACIRIGNGGPNSAAIAMVSDSHLSHLKLLQLRPFRRQELAQRSLAKVVCSECIFMGGSAQHCEQGLSTIFLNCACFIVQMVWNSPQLLPTLPDFRLIEAKNGTTGPCIRDKWKYFRLYHTADRLHKP